MKGYKLTDKKGNTYNNIDWGVGITHKANGKGDLCGSGWIHFYDDLIVGLMLNPIHANFNKKTLRAWECKATGKIKNNDNTKFGTTELTTIKEVDVPKITKIQRMVFGILCVKKVCKDDHWNIWADKWLSGEDRTTDSARVTYVTYNAVTVAAAADVAYAAAAAADVAYAAISVAAAAAVAVAYAAISVAAATVNIVDINLKQIVTRVMKEY